MNNEPLTPKEEYIESTKVRLSRGIDKLIWDSKLEAFEEVEDALENVKSISYAKKLISKMKHISNCT